MLRSATFYHVPSLNGDMDRVIEREASLEGLPPEIFILKAIAEALDNRVIERRHIDGPSDETVHFAAQVDAAIKDQLR